MKTPSPPVAAVFLLSGSALAYEVILVRLLSMTRFHHLAFMVLSLALLGYGVSGVILARFRAGLVNASGTWFRRFAAAFAAGAPICFQASQRIPVFPGEWIWSPAAALTLVALYLVLSLPFLAAACGVGLAYCAGAGTPGNVYRADLLGAAAGSLGALAALWLPEAGALWVPWAGGFGAAALTALPEKKGLALALVIPAVLGPVTGPTWAVRLIVSPDKPLSMARSAEGAETLADIYTPLGRITAVRNRLAPYRHAPGLSLAFQGAVGAHWGVFTDGESFDPLPPGPEAPPGELAYLDYLPEALSYRLLSDPQVLVLESGVVSHIAQALANGASRVDAVVSNPGWRRLFDGAAAARVGGYLAAPGVRLMIRAPRAVLRGGGGVYDLIVMGGPGPSALFPDHRHTVEAFTEALGRLDEGGLLAIGGPSDLPPRVGLRLLATAALALKRSGERDPGAALAMIRSLRTVLILARKGPLTAGEIHQIRRFCRERRFDPVWFPGMAPSEANRWSRLDRPCFHEGAAALLGPDAAAYQARYKFDVSPVLDDRPYVSAVLKPATLKELFALRGSGALGLLSFAEPVLAATAVQAALLSLLGVWLPLRRFGPVQGRTHRGVVFFMLGAGFMMAEVAVMEKMGLFLSEPVLAVSVTLAVFLAVAGLGGGLSNRWHPRRDRGFQPAGAAAALVAAVVLLYLVALPMVLNALMGQALGVRLFLALLIIAPLALAMGLPFPLAVSALKAAEPGAVPWAWGLNGCGALVGPVIGMALAVFGGVSWVFGAAVFCYGAAFLAGVVLGRGSGRISGRRPGP